MKNLASSLLILTVLVSGCKSWEPAMLTVEKKPLTPKLLHLEGRFNDVTGGMAASADDEAAIFTKEVQENLLDTTGNKYGTITLDRRIMKLKQGVGYSMATGLLLMAPSVVGFPLQRFVLTDSIVVKVLDSKNNVIGEYPAAGKAKSTVAFYYGYSEKDAQRKVYPEALKDALNNVRPLIQADAQRLNAKLQEAGKME